MEGQKAFDALLFSLWTRQTHKLYVCFRVVRTDAELQQAVFISRFMDEIQPAVHTPH